MKRLPAFSLAGLVAAGMLISAPALAAGADANEDGQIDQSELDRSLSMSMQSMDSDGDGQINESEFEQASGGVVIFSDFDTNADGAIDQQEMSQSVMTNYGEEDGQSLSEDGFARYEQDFQAGGQATEDHSASSELDTSGNVDTSSSSDLTSGEEDLSASSDLDTSGDVDTSSSSDLTSGEEDLSASSELDTSGNADTSGSSDLTGTSMGGSLAAYTADELMGADVTGADGESIGEVSDLVLDGNNEMSAVIIDIGGFLGIGSKSVALPATDIQVMQATNGDVELSTSYVEADLEMMSDYEEIEGDDSRLYSSDSADTMVTE